MRAAPPASARRDRRRRLLAIPWLALLGGCTGMMFNPVAGPPLASEDSEVRHRAVRFEACDGVGLAGWFLPAVATGRASGTVVFLDGAENVRRHVDHIDWLPAAGYNVLLFNYRGYGGSGGEPSLAGFHRDLRAAIATADRLDGLPRARLVVFGQSLGGAVATVALARSEGAADLGALVVDSAPRDYRQIVRETLAESWYTWPLHVPLSWLITDDFAADEAVERLPAIPKLWIANGGDRSVGSHHTVALHERAPGPSALWRIAPRPHMATLDDPGARAAFARWLDRALDTRRARPAPASGAQAGDGRGADPALR